MITIPEIVFIHIRARLQQWNAPDVPLNHALQQGFVASAMPATKSFYEQHSREAFICFNENFTVSRRVYCCVIAKPMNMAKNKVGALESCCQICKHSRKPVVEISNQQVLVFNTLPIVLIFPGDRRDAADWTYLEH